MKIKIIIGIFLFFFGINSFIACDDETIIPKKEEEKEKEKEEEEEEERMIWDFSPIILFISVQDSFGNDLLNPETKGSIADQGIKAIYKDIIYEKDSAAPATKAYSANFHGLQAIQNKEGKYYLTFGEFNGDDTFDKEQVIIDWNDGVQDIITFSSKLTWKSINEPVFDREFLFNGKSTESGHSIFTVIK